MVSQVWLDQEDFVSQGDSLPIGGQVNVNHENCPAGKDTKKRLYIKKVDGGNIIAFCHHCGIKGAKKKQGYAGAIKTLQQAGLFGEESSEVDTIDSETSTKQSPKLVTWPSDIDCTVETAPKEIVEWFVKTGVKIKTVMTEGAGYSPEHKGFIMPLCNESFQVRLNDAAKAQIGARYLTLRTAAGTLWSDEHCPFYANTHSSKAPTPFSHKIVIVEDYLSALKVNQEYGCTTIWAVGTNNQEKIANSIKVLVDDGIVDKTLCGIYIMFDNDKPDIVQKAMDLKKFLDLGLSFTPNRIVVCDNTSDPKHMRHKDLELQLDIAGFHPTHLTGPVPTILGGIK